MKLKLNIENKFLYVERGDGLILGQNLSMDRKTVEIDTCGYFIMQANHFLDDLKKEPEPFSVDEEHDLFNKMSELWKEEAKSVFWEQDASEDQKKPFSVDEDQNLLNKMLDEDQNLLNKMSEFWKEEAKSVFWEQDASEDQKKQLVNLQRAFACWEEREQIKKKQITEGSK